MRNGRRSPRAQGAHTRRRRSREEGPTRRFSRPPDSRTRESGPWAQQEWTPPLQSVACAPHGIVAEREGSGQLPIGRLIYSIIRYSGQNPVWGYQRLTFQSFIHLLPIVEGRGQTMNAKIRILHEFGRCPLPSRNGIGRLHMAID